MLALRFGFLALFAVGLVSLGMPTLGSTPDLRFRKSVACGPFHIALADDGTVYSFLDLPQSPVGVRAISRRGAIKDLIVWRDVPIVLSFDGTLMAFGPSLHPGLGEVFNLPRMNLSKICRWGALLIFAYVAWDYVVLGFGPQIDPDRGYSSQDIESRVLRNGLLMHLGAFGYVLGDMLRNRSEGLMWPNSTSIRSRDLFNQFIAGSVDSLQYDAGEDDFTIYLDPHIMPVPYTDTFSLPRSARALKLSELLGPSLKRDSVDCESALRSLYK